MDDVGESFFREWPGVGGQGPSRVRSVYMVWLPNARYQKPKSKESAHIWQVTLPWESESESCEDTVHTFSVSEPGDKGI